MSNLLSLCAAEADVVSEAIKVDGNWGTVWSTVVTGIVVVFLILAILVFLLWCMGKIFSTISKSAEKKKAAAAASAAKAVTETPAPAAVPEEEYEDEDDCEIIAVISAAIAAYGEAEGKRYNITSVKKRDKAVRSPWSMAGISDNTRGF